MKRIEEEAARLGVLVEEMLLLARLDQARQLQSTPVDLAVIAWDAAQDARAAAPGRPITVEAPAPVTVLGDEARLRQVASNLLTNALSTPRPAGPSTSLFGRMGTSRSCRWPIVARGCRKRWPSARSSLSSAVIRRAAGTMAAAVWDFPSSPPSPRRTAARLRLPRGRMEAPCSACSSRSPGRPRASRRTAVGRAYGGGRSGGRRHRGGDVRGRLSPHSGSCAEPQVPARPGRQTGDAGENQAPRVDHHDAAKGSEMAMWTVPGPGRRSRSPPFGL